MSGLFAWEDGRLTRRMVVRCALARVCGACGRPLGRPIVFLGTAEETARNAFHLPPLHSECVEAVRDLGGAPDQIVRTAGFEFVRPQRDDRDPEPRYQPNSVLA